MEGFSNKETYYAYKLLTNNIKAYNEVVECCNAAFISEVYMKYTSEYEIPYISKIKFEEIFDIVVKG